jgi:hypothetical protein
MNSKLLLRIASILILVHLLGHTMGHLTWDKPEDTKMAGVVTVMKGYKAEFMGADRSMADYHNGYSLMIFGLFGMSIVIIWLASGFVNDNKVIAGKVLYPIGIVYLIFGIVEYIYFFPFAAVTSFVAGLLIIAALMRKQ